MATFPSREGEIVALALKLIEGLTENPDVFPSPVISPDELAATLQRFQDAEEAATKATGAARDAHAIKDETLNDLTGQMRFAFKYAESVARGEESTLSLVGWGGRNSGGGLEPPTQARDLEIVKTGRDWLVLDWKQPSEGGHVAAYEIHVSRREEGVWREVGTALTTEKLISGQERGVELEFHVVAVNKAGRANPSNSQRVTL